MAAIAVKKSSPRSRFPGVFEGSGRARRRHGGKTPESHGEKADVRKDVQRIRDRAEGRCVGEEVVALVLLLRRDGEDGDEEERGRHAEHGEAASRRHFFGTAVVLGAGAPAGFGASAGTYPGGRRTAATAGTAMLFFPFFPTLRAAK